MGISIPTPAARTDRYSHDRASDEEDGPGAAEIQEEFKNFTSTVPRFSHLLDQLNLDDLSSPSSPSSNSSQGPQSIVSKLILEPKHEKRDSGISGIEDGGAETVKILDGGSASKVCRQSSVDSTGTVEDKDEETDDEEGIITHIDEVCWSSRQPRVGIIWKQRTTLCKRQYF